MSYTRAIRRLGPTGLIAVVLALSMTLFGAAVGSAAAGAAPGRIHAKAKHVRVTAPVRGATAGGRAVRAVFIPKSFSHPGGVLMARGVLKGRILRPGPESLKFRKRGVLMRVTSVDGHRAPAPTARTTAFPPTPPAGACNVLNLALAPLDLNVLGLQVHLNRVVLNIVAQSGAKQLFGQPAVLRRRAARRRQPAVEPARAGHGAAEPHPRRTRGTARLSEELTWSGRRAPARRPGFTRSSTWTTASTCRWRPVGYLTGAPGRSARADVAEG